jgi:hypothetical protein
MNSVGGAVWHIPRSAGPRTKHLTTRVARCLRRYLFEDGELHVTLPEPVHAAMMNAVEGGPHTHALFLDAQMHAFREVAEILPVFFKSPEGLQYSRRVIEAAQKQFFEAKSKAVMPVAAAIVAFEKIYLATEKYYSYKIHGDTQISISLLPPCCRLGWFCVGSLFTDNVLLYSTAPS